MESTSGTNCNIAIFASGGGTNAQEIINTTEKEGWGKVRLIVTDNPIAGVIERAKNHHIPIFILTKSERKDGHWLIQLLEKHSIHLVVLAGYLKLVPLELVQAFPNRMINIHPALLPEYGGKGMYGMKVHQAVISAQESTSGITIHYVNERFDEGEIIFQQSLTIKPDWTPDDLAGAIHKLEWKHFPATIRTLSEKLGEKA